jgi:transposase
MPTKRITMRKLRDVLRLRLSGGLSIREISRSTKLSVGGIQKLLSRARELGLSWPLSDDLDDNQLARLFYPGADTRAASRFQVPAWPTIHQELKRPYVTKQLLWEEYTQQFPNRSYSYSQFCDRYRHWVGKQRRSMRQHHKAGEKCFVDYSGSTVPIINGMTGEIRKARTEAKD